MSTCRFGSIIVTVIVFVCYVNSDLLAAFQCDNQVSSKYFVSSVDVNYGFPAIIRSDICYDPGMSHTEWQIQRKIYCLPEFQLLKSVQDMLLKLNKNYSIHVNWYEYRFLRLRATSNIASSGIKENRGSGHKAWPPGYQQPGRISYIEL